ncbi:SURF1 family protein [Paeniglutamicibacter gangotriensis]|uniref:SURF1-like protein n=1 Tax=Paeniglutamicibacter gangotriensis TaxID=254787 RepID=A0A5B0EFW8_9MICC|nr:SURF1 family protein [Paeniglutamicibacter gangotriensis]
MRNSLGAAGTNRSPGWFHWLLCSTSTYGSSVLKTALKPRWILALVGALVVATGFVLLSQWQFNRSQTEAPPPPSTTERVVPLVDHLEPGVDLMAVDADQMVSATGSFLPGKQILVKNRVEDSNTGFWVVAAFKVDGAPGGNTIPVVRGWQGNDATPAPAPTGTVELTGRLLPTEAPIAQDAGQRAYASLSVAELINVWDVPAYSGFITATTVTGAGGTDLSAAASNLVPVDVDPQPQERQINWLNIFYGIEWVVFAGFAVFLWYRLVADEFRKSQEDIADAAALAAGLDPAIVYQRQINLENPTLEPEPKD